MENHSLSSEEIKTIESYKKIAVARGKTHSNPDFWRPEFEKFRNLLQKGKVIDIGCGSGRDAILFTQNGYEYLGIDICEEMLAIAKELVPRANFIKMNMYSLGFSPQSLDGFWAPASLLHIPKRKLGRVLEEIKRIIKPGGIGFLAMKEGNGERMIQGSFEGDERFFAFYQEDDFLKVLLQNGFEVLEHSRDLRQYNPPKAKTIWLLYFVKVRG